MTELEKQMEQRWANAFVSMKIWGGRREVAAPNHCITFPTKNRGLGFMASPSTCFDAVFVFHDWDPDKGSVEVTVASNGTNWLTRNKLRTVADYAIDVLDARLMVARHSEHNRVARRMWKAMGAEETLIPQLWGENEAMAVAVLTRDTWLNSRFNKYVET